MLKYATYAVISPEGCASILWKSADKAADAAEAMGITSTRLFDLKLIDGIIEEPLGGAHRDLDQVVSAVGEQLSESLAELSKLDSDSLLARRRARLQEFGTYTEK
jgi:acetyl-CoA carboxylase carboxyl transferase subunit alpha